MATGENHALHIVFIDIPAQGTRGSLCDVSVNDTGKLVDNGLVTDFSGKVGSKLFACTENLIVGTPRWDRVKAHPGQPIRSVIHVLKV
jgi:hypothetical protein